MYKRLFGVLIAVAFFVFTATAYAESGNVPESMVDKLKRGIINTFTGWVEFPAQIGKGYYEGFRGDKQNKLLGVAVGVFEGAGHAAGRTLSGVADVVGFWAAAPKDNKNIGIPLDSAYPWEMGKSYDIFDPNFIDAYLSPMVKKFFRGAGNTVFGFLELPNQIAKGLSEKKAEIGILKGLYYWSSREVSGISDIVSAPFANPEDNAGIHFDKEWSWDVVIKKAKPEENE